MTSVRWHFISCIGLGLIWSLGGCFSFPTAHFYYPTPLVEPARQLFAWPVSGSGEFRFLAQNDAHGLGNWNGLADELDLERDWSSIRALADPASSVTVLLQPRTASETRDRVNVLLGRLSHDLPLLSTHIVVTETELGDVKNGIALHRALSKEEGFHQEQRPSDFGIAIAGAITKYIVSVGTPNFVVVPLASGEDRVAVYGDLRIEGQPRTVTECSRAEAVSLLVQRLADPKARELKSDWRAGDPPDKVVISGSGSGRVFVVALFPHDAPEACRAWGEKLGQALCSTTLAPISIALADTNWNWSECVSAEYVQKQLDSEPVCNAMVGPVRQFAMIPEPLKDQP